MLIIPNTISIYFIDKKGCKDMYKQLISDKKSDITSIKKMGRDRKAILEDWMEKYIWTIF